MIKLLQLTSCLSCQKNQNFLLVFPNNLSKIFGEGPNIFESYWIIHIGVSRKFLEMTLPISEEVLSQKFSQKHF